MRLSAASLDRLVGVEEKRALRRQREDHHFWSLIMLAVTARHLSSGHLGGYKGGAFLPPRVSNPLKATVEAFSEAYSKATSDEQAALRAWMRGIILPGKWNPEDLEKCRKNEKGSIEARDRRILEFPLSMTPNAVAKALRAEGCYSKGTTVHYIEHRVRRLREKSARERA
jgi:hypothetical protein